MQTFQEQILCAEGHEDTRELVVVYLGLAGYQVTPVGNTIAECIEMAASRSFHLYLIGDLFLDGSGFDLAQQIRSFDRHTPLIFHSARAYPEDIERGLKAGAQAYITKPSDPAHLVETIRLLINTKEIKGTDLNNSHDERPGQIWLPTRSQDPNQQHN